MIGREGQRRPMARRAAARYRRPMHDDGPIVFLLPSLDVGGTERHMITLANAFAARGRRVAICTFGTTAGMLRDEIDAGVAVDTLGLSRARYFRRPLGRYLAHVRPRVLVCAMHTAAVFGTLARLTGHRRTPVVIFEGGFAAGGRQGLAGRLARAARTAALYRLAARVLTNAPGIAEEIARTARIPARRIAVVPNPIAEAAFDDAGAPAAWPARHPAVCVVARLNANKDVASIVRAVAMLRQMRALSLVVIGDGPERAALEALAGNLGLGGDAHFLGWQARPWRFLRRAAVFAQASHTEGFSNALLEALAVGCPVVATDAPGATRALLDGGRIGALVPVGVPAAMAHAIAAALDAPPPRDRLIARARAITGASVDAWLAEIDGVA